MKKMLSVLLLGGALLSATLAPALAENYKYRLYNTQTKTTIYAPMITMGGSDTEYYIAFLDTSIDAPCVIDDSSLNKNSQGLMGGNCISMLRTNLGTVYAWRELSAGNYYAELRSITNERRQQGMHMVKFSTK